MAKPKRGDTLELVVDDLAFGGEAVGRADGYVMFVRGGVPGDRLRVTVTEARGRFGRGVIQEVLQAVARPRGAALPVFWALRRLPAPADRLSRPARVQGAAGPRVPHAPGRPAALRAAADRPGPRAVRLPQQDGVHRGRPRPGDRAARRRALRRRARHRALLAAVRDDEHAARRAPAPGPRAGAVGVGSADRARPAALRHPARGAAIPARPWSTSWPPPPTWRR